MSEEEKKVDSFVFYRSFYEAIQELDNSHIGELMRMICEYSLNDNIIEPKDTISKVFFQLVKPQIDANQRRRNHGSLGGRPKKPMVIEEKTSGFSNENQWLLNEKPNVNVNDNANVNDNHNVNVNVNVNANENVNSNVNENENENVNVNECRTSSEVHATAQKKAKTERFIKPTLEELESYCKEKGYTFSPEKFLSHYNANGWKVGRNPMKSWKAACSYWNGNEYNSSTPNEYKKPPDSDFVNDFIQNLERNKNEWEKKIEKQEDDW